MVSKTRYTIIPFIIQQGFLLFIAIFFLFSPVQSQQINISVKQYLENQIKNHSRATFQDDIKDFYEYSGYRLVWLNNKAAAAQLFFYLEHAAASGLKSEDYNTGLIKSYIDDTVSYAGPDDSIAADIKLTGAAIHFFRDITFGKAPELLRFNGLDYSPGCINIGQAIAAALANNSFDQLLAKVEDNSASYLALKKSLLVLLQRDTADDKLIQSAVANGNNKPLLQKLYRLGMLPSTGITLPDSAMKTCLIHAQRLFCLPENGRLTSALVKELNIPVRDRVDALCAAMNTCRWLACIKRKWPHVVVVNIPSASLLVYAGDSVTLQSRLIVGKFSTQTPTLCSIIKEVILYPYWTVPAKIASRELLPMIKRNPKYLKDNNFQVLNKQGKLVNPVSVDWKALTATNFPYTLRQSTGCDNSLGIVKLNFYSPFDVYLHDTPWKILFNLNNRFFSHGCMRLQKAVELAHLLLRENSIAIDTLVQKGCLNDQSPLTVPATEKMPVFVLYHTAWTDSAASVRFYNDVYRKLPKANSQAVY